MPDNRDKFDSIALPCVLPPEEQAAFDRAMRDCYIDTCDEESLEALMHNTGKETDLETIFEKLAKLTVVPIASGKSRDPIVFMLDSLSALDNKKC